MSTPPTTAATTSSSVPHSARAEPLQSHFTKLAQGPITTHLTDTNAIPILSTHPQPSSPSLSSLSSAFVQAHDTASRMGLGRPLRVTLATASGAAVIQTATVDEGGGGGGGEMLVGTVIAKADRLAEARMVSWGVEEVARRFQKSAAGDGL
ncbi:hypothetical protein L873DRAFT_1715390 [Choiromyces venosus 120613-1]|uniref:Roadblock/LAMTOR2 domain-containing protein n=1 Tax=Choiromyces venosus 120613-1 TaxID=1336337 RepID=A0A3N4IZ23_9PEZI|nr:hypothetical protein L873DRAFT_1715390 [Choiromyces venosus 120613-1]